MSKTTATTTPAPTRRTVAYIRVSTEEQATEGYSLDAQERQAKAYAVAREWPEVAEVYADAGVSGATRDRPALKRLLADAQAGTIGRLVVTKLDRIGRRAADILTIEEELDAAGVERVYIKDSIDTSTPVGRMLRTVLAAVAELERDMILERTRSGYVEKARKGEVWRSKCPYGYRYTPGDKKAGALGRLEVDPDTAPIVRRIFTRLAAGASSLKVASELTADGVPTHQGRPFWHDSTIRKIARNPTYAGTAYWVRFKNVHTPAGKTRLVRNEDPTTAFALEVPAIVTCELADAAHAALAGNQKHAKRNAKRDYLLSGGLVSCGVTLEHGEECGHTMMGISDGRSPTYYAYRCVCYTPDGKRIQHYVPGAALEAAVWAALCAALADPSAVLADAQALADASRQQAQDAEAELRRLERAAAEITTRLDALLDMRLAREIDPETYTRKMGQLAERKASLDEHAAALAARRDAALAHLLPIDDIKATCALMATGLDALTFEERQHVVRTLCRRITATPTTAIIDGALPRLSGASQLEVSKAVGLASPCWATAR